MNILLITQYFPPDLSAGSFRMSALVNEISKLMNNDTKLEVFTTYPHRYDNFRDDKIDFDNANIKIYKIKLLKHKNNKLFQIINYLIFFIWVLLKTNHKNYDKLFVTSSKLMTSFLGAIIAKNKKIKFYCEYRDNFLQSLDLLGGIYNNKILKFFLYKIENFVCNNCDKLNLVSEGFNKYFINRYPNLDISNYTNGIDNLYLNYNFNNVNNSNKIKKILYVGNIGFGQGLEKIIPSLALKNYKTCEFIIIGDGSSKKLLLNRIKELNISNIKVLNPIKREQLNVYYKKSDILFLHLNNHQSSMHVLPSKIFEYAATNKPILAGLNGFSANFCKENIKGCFVFNSCDVNDGQSKMEKIKVNYYDRKSFISKYERQTITSNLAKEIINL